MSNRPVPPPSPGDRQAGFSAWGRGPHANVRHPFQRPLTLTQAAQSWRNGAGTRLAYGQGRSYGDVCLNPGGSLVDCRGLDRFIAFDRDTGILECEAGVTLDDILRHCTTPLPDGGAWFLPVTPGTRFVSVGGAVANDVHGKNHVSMGSFGRHVLSLDLARSDGEVLTCTQEQNRALFRATIGGLGLTGLILRIRLALRRVPGTMLAAEHVRFASLHDFFTLEEQASAEGWEYSAAWIDCRAGGANLGRGIHTRARHLIDDFAPPPRLSAIHIPVDPPLPLVAGWAGRLFNLLQWHRPVKPRRRVPYAAILHPLDAVGGWNRLYGPAGFFQFQCVLPPDAAPVAVAEMLRQTALHGQGSPLAVLKRFGSLPAAGMLSFAMEGTTLALDFADRGAGTRALLSRLHAITIEAGGRLYPAKDRCMTEAEFQAAYPQAAEFRAHIDPVAASGLARRVGLVANGGDDAGG